MKFLKKKQITTTAAATSAIVIQVMGHIQHHRYSLVAFYGIFPDSHHRKYIGIVNDLLNGVNEPSSFQTSFSPCDSFFV